MEVMPTYLHLPEHFISSLSGSDRYVKLLGVFVIFSCSIHSRMSNGRPAHKGVHDDWEALFIRASLADKVSIVNWKQ